MDTLFLLFAFTAEAHAQAGDPPWEIRFRQVSDDVYVAYRPDPLRFIVEGNVTIIVNHSDVVVVDGSGAPVAARQVIAYIRERTPNPVRILINTHGHGDHTLGNQEYVRAFPGVEIIARPEARRGVDRGVDLDNLKPQVNLDQERDRFTGDDPVLRYFFKEYFSDPNIERTFEAVIANTIRP